MRGVVVTGASTGIGYATAKALLLRGFAVFGSVRADRDGVRLAADLGPQFRPLIFDVTDEAAVARAAAQVRAELGRATLAGLVNNAGIAVAGPLLHLPVDELRRQLEVNLVGQLTVTQAFAPLLGADRTTPGSPGRIVMMSSVSGREAAPFLGPYGAAKFALEGLSEALRRELMIYDIDVIIVAPGAVRTPIWAKADQADATPYAGTDYAAPLEAARRYMSQLGERGLAADAVGALVVKALTRRRPRTRYAISPSPIEAFVMSVLPKRLIDRLMAAQLGLSLRKG
jgi:NAD(P)-dependent dehydrogenase (short-subunit alcohol dehydrogenase family)